MELLNVPIAFTECLDAVQATSTNGLQQWTIQTGHCWRRACTLQTLFDSIATSWMDDFIVHRHWRTMSEWSDSTLTLSYSAGKGRPCTTACWCDSDLSGHWLQILHNHGVICWCMVLQEQAHHDLDTNMATGYDSMRLRLMILWSGFGFQFQLIDALAQTNWRLELASL